jgi:RimJ/RimL family protein N-acetyltransferase/uncharacterized protein (DUF952 family)
MVVGVVTLRPPQTGDAEALFPLIFNTGVTDTISWDGPESMEGFRNSLAYLAREVSTGKQHFFVIVEESSGNPIGSADIRPYQDTYRSDVGLWIGKAYQDKGYGTSVVRQLVDYGFERLGLEKIEATVFVGNWASRRVFEKNGFQLEGSIRKAVCKRGEFLDEWLFGILKEEYRIVHVCTRGAWEVAQGTREYRDPSLESEGFIHCSQPDKVLRVANARFRDVPDLVLLWIDPQKVRPDIRWESVGEDEFPHIYGPINLDAVVEVRNFLPDPDGIFRKIPLV